MTFDWLARVLCLVGDRRGGQDGVRAGLWRTDEVIDARSLWCRVSTPSDLHPYPFDRWWRAGEQAGGGCRVMSTNEVIHICDSQYNPAQVSG